MKIPDYITTTKNNQERWSHSRVYKRISSPVEFSHENIPGVALLK